MRTLLLSSSLAVLLAACAGSDLPAPSSATDPANPKATVTPFDAGPNALTTQLAMPSATTSGSAAPMMPGHMHGGGAMPMAPGAASPGPSGK